MSVLFHAGATGVHHLAVDVGTQDHCCDVNKPVEELRVQRTMNAAKQGAQKAVQHRTASWISPSAYPYVVAVGGAVCFAVYSATRHVAQDPDLGCQDIDKLDEKAADKYRESPLRKAVTGQ